jgi:hypothetical protein
MPLLFLGLRHPRQAPRLERHRVAVRQVEVDEVLPEQPPACAHTSLRHEKCHLHTYTAVAAFKFCTWSCACLVALARESASMLPPHWYGGVCPCMPRSKLCTASSASPTPCCYNNSSLQRERQLHGIPSMQTGGLQRDATSHRHTGSATT